VAAISGFGFHNCLYEEPKVTKIQACSIGEKNCYLKWLLGENLEMYGQAMLLGTWDTDTFGLASFTYSVSIVCTWHQSCWYSHRLVILHPRSFLNICTVLGLLWVLWYGVWCRNKNHRLLESRVSFYTLKLFLLTSSIKNFLPSMYFAFYQLCYHCISWRS
jgi:hypothetical protein